jgi:hypothetical protein
MILVTGETIPIAKRIGLLDRKLRVVSENTETEEECHPLSTTSELPRILATFAILTRKLV